MNLPLNYAMLGGGADAFIGAIHRTAARLDGRWNLVAGALSSNATVARESGAELGIAPERCYDSWQQLLETEGRRTREQPDDPQRLHAVAIVTPNHLHHPMAAAAIREGLAVICDKPLTRTVDEAAELVALVEEHGVPFCLTHNYSGYPMVREARQRVADGRLGQVRRIVVEYPQGWLGEPIEQQGQKQATWRTDPKLAGPAGCMGDIGTHAAHLAEFVGGQRVAELCADLHAFVPGRALDDDGSVLLRFDGGARGLLFASQIATGCENGLHLRIWGDRAGLSWRQEEPNTLLWTPADAPAQLIRTGGADLGDDATRSTRLPAGHPEGFLGAFANLYSEFADRVEAWAEGRPTPPTALLLPDAEDGLHSLRIVDAMVRSARDGASWQDVEAD